MSFGRSFISKTTRSVLSGKRVGRLHGILQVPGTDAFQEKSGQGADPNRHPGVIHPSSLLSNQIQSSKDLLSPYLNAINVHPISRLRRVLMGFLVVSAFLGLAKPKEQSYEMLHRLNDSLLNINICTYIPVLTLGWLSNTNVNPPPNFHLTSNTSQSTAARPRKNPQLCLATIK